MKPSDFPTLTQFFGCYFHQDWVDEFSTPEEAIAAFKVEASSESIQFAREELVQIAPLVQASGDGQRILQELGCYYDPTADGLTIIEWLRQVRENLGNCSGGSPNFIPGYESKDFLMERVTFGKSWFLAKRRFTEIWDEGKARAAHERRDPYAAAISDGQRTVSVVEAYNDCFGVFFLDPLGREFVTYQFQELEPERLFLTMATHREFDGETDRVKCGTTYYFKPDGRVTIEAEDFVAATLSTKETQTNVSGNWEPYPAFGEYSSLARIDR